MDSFQVRIFESQSIPCSEPFSEENVVFLQILHPFCQTERGLKPLRSQTPKETTNSMEQPGPGLCLLRIQKQQTVAFTSCRCCLNSLFITC